MKTITYDCDVCGKKYDTPIVSLHLSMESHQYFNTVERKVGSIDICSKCTTKFDIHLTVNEPVSLRDSLLNILREVAK